MIIGPSCQPSTSCKHVSHSLRRAHDYATTVQTIVTCYGGYVLLDTDLDILICSQHVEGAFAYYQQISSNKQQLPTTIVSALYVYM